MIEHKESYCHLSISGDVKAIDILIQNEANTNAVDNDGYTALDLARLFEQKESNEIIELLASVETETETSAE